MTEPQADGRPVRTEATEAPPPDQPLDDALPAGDESLIDSAVPSTEQLRIAAIQAVVAAGLAPSTGRHQPEEAEVPLSIPQLPDWTDPPTGQVPRVLLDRDRAEDERPGERPFRGPIWRQDAADWEQEADLGLAFLLHEDEGEGGVTLVAGREPFGFEDELFAELDAIAPRLEWPESPSETGIGLGRDGPLSAPPSPAAASADHGPRAAAGDAAEPGEPPPPGPAGQGVARRDRGGERAPGRKGRDPLVATLTGLGVGALAVACFLLGAPTTLALVAVALSIAAGEVLAALRRSGRRPAAPVSLAAVPSMVVGCYLFGPVASTFVLAGALILATIWFLAAGARAAPVRDLGSTLLVACWVGVPGAFAGLLLAPSRFPHRHGVALLFAVVAVTVAHDVGSYAVGGRLGRHRLAPRVSPNKTWEGIVGGSALAFVVALLGVSHLHPLTLGAAAALAVLVSVFGPLGDLAESLVKRDLALKDMGRLLPAHGGLFDRVDAMLFVLPAAYGLFQLVHLG